MALTTGAEQKWHQLRRQDSQHTVTLENTAHKKDLGSFQIRKQKNCEGCLLLLIFECRENNVFITKFKMSRAMNMKQNIGIDSRKNPVRVTDKIALEH